MRAIYRIEEQTDDRLVIRDIGHKYCMTVTNDAQAVVQDLHRNGILGNRKLFYYDSEGELDELIHDGHGMFQGFAPGKVA